MLNRLWEAVFFLYSSPAAVSSFSHRVSLLPRPEPERCGSMWPVGPVYVDEPRGRTEGLTPADSPALTQTSFSLTGPDAHSSLWIYYWTQEPLGCAIWLLKKPVEIIHQKGSLVLLLLHFLLLLLLLFVHFALFFMRTLHRFLRLFDGRKICKCFNVDVIFILLMFLPRCHVDKCIYLSYTGIWCKLTRVQRSANVQLKLTYAS